MKTFDIIRKESGQSIGVGVIFPDNKVALQWYDIKSIVIHENIEDVISIHCNGDLYNDYY